jgi:hypothetical protein
VHYCHFPPSNLAFPFPFLEHKVSPLLFLLECLLISTKISFCIYVDIYVVSVCGCRSKITLCLLFKLGGGVTFHSLSVFLNHSLPPQPQPLDHRPSIISIVVVVFPTQIMGLCGLLSNKGPDAGYYPLSHFNTHLILVHRKIVILGDGACGFAPLSSTSINE